MRVLWLLALLLSAAAFASNTTTGPATSITISSASGGPCPVTSGPLTLSVFQPRTSAISPFLAFFDATGTTDTAVATNFTPFQHVIFTWNFGDGGTSGTTNWVYGSNAGHNSRNTATGGIAAHLYVVPDGTGDQTYTVTVTATDGTNTATCSVGALAGVTAFDPSGSNGFPGNKTTCYFNSTVGTGCPSGANQTLTSTTHSPAAGTRILYQCGGNFTGNSSSGTINKWSIDAYGGCQGTQSGLPTVTGTITVSSVSTGAVASDGRISNLNGATGSNAMIIEMPFYAPPYVAISQITLWNLMIPAVSNTAMYTYMGTQMGFVQLDFVGMGNQQQTYINDAENNCLNGSNTYAGCAGAFTNIAYQAVLGSHFDGTGSTVTGAGVETVRVSACRMCVFENSDFLNANTFGSTFKLHDGNNKVTQCQWTGNWTENIEISDNTFTGQSGAAIADWTAQNPVTDERLRNVVVERNLFAPGASGKVLYFGVMNGTLRDNVFYNSGISLGNRGVQGTSNNTPPPDSGCTGTGTTAAPQFPLFPQYVEFLNNTCVNGCLVFQGGGNMAPANNSNVQNTLISSGSAISSAGTGNIVANNTTNTALNPGFTNGSGLFKLISDFKPTANYGGATPVPVQYDALGIPWPPTWSLGAVHP